MAWNRFDSLKNVKLFFKFADEVFGFSSHPMGYALGMQCSCARLGWLL